MSIILNVWENDLTFIAIQLSNKFVFRVSLTLACPMNLKLYPLDRQKCSLRVASCKSKNTILIQNLSRKHFSGPSFLNLYKLNFLIADGWTTDDLQYLWKRVDPVQIVENLHLPRFTLEKYISDYCNIKTNTGNWVETKIHSVIYRQIVYRYISYNLTKIPGHKNTSYSYFL